MANARAKAKLDPNLCYGCEKRFPTTDGVSRHLGHASNKSCLAKMGRVHQPFMDAAAKLHSFGR